MQQKIAIVTTITRPDEWQYAWKEALDCYTDLADEVIVVMGDLEHDSKLMMEYGKKKNLWSYYLHWPDEWHWSELPRHLNFGFDRVGENIDWAIKMDLDYLIHENDWSKIKKQLFLAQQFPVAAGVKLTMLNRELGYKKCRINNMVNMKHWKDIEFGKAVDKETDWCFPIWREDKTSVVDVYDTGLNIYNYDYFFRTKEVAKKAFWRFSKAYYRGTGSWGWGNSPDDALDKFTKQMVGRLKTQPLKKREHPKYIINRINKMTPEEMGYSNWGAYKTQ